MLRATVFVIVFAVLLSVLIGCAESLEIKLISPMGAAARSIIPGWGQVYTRSRLEGAVIFLSIGILGGGGVRADAIYRDVYNNEYKPAVLAESNQADSYFDRANQYYKLSRFLLYTAAGIWAYSIIDAYVDAHIYNARQQVKMLDINDERLQQLKLGSGLGANSSLRSMTGFVLTPAKAKGDDVGFLLFPRSRRPDTRCFHSVSSVQNIYFNPYIRGD